MGFYDTSLSQLYNAVGYSFNQSIVNALSGLENGGLVRTLIGDFEDRPLKFSQLELHDGRYYLLYAKGSGGYLKESGPISEDNFFTVDELAEMFSSPFLKAYATPSRERTQDRFVAMGPFTYDQAFDLMRFFVFKNLAAEASNVAEKSVKKYKNDESVKPSAGAPNLK